VYLAVGAEPTDRLAVKTMILGSATDHRNDLFLREMQTLEKLDHPRIPRILGTGEAKGSLFFTMPYIDGETLRQRLHRSGPLSFREALLISHDIPEVIKHAVEASRPRTRYVVTPAAKAQVQLRRLGGDRLWDAVMRRTYRIR